MNSLTELNEIGCLSDKNFKTAPTIARSMVHGFAGLVTNGTLIHAQNLVHSTDKRARYTSKVHKAGVSKLSFVLVFLLIHSTSSAMGAEVITGKNCPSNGAVMTVGYKKYTCVKSGTKLIWNNGMSIKPPVTKASAIPSPTPSFTPTALPTPTSPRPNGFVRVFNLLPTFSMTPYSERLRRNVDAFGKDLPDGSSYIEQTRGKVEILVPTITNFDPSSEYFVFISGGPVYYCKSGDLNLPLDARAGDVKSVLGSLLPIREKHNFPGIVFKVLTFPISFTCFYGNEIKYFVSVIETIGSGTQIKSQSRPVEFVTPMMWVELPPKPTPTPTQVNTFSITPNTICSPEGATVTNIDGKTYSCRKSSVDGQLRWGS